MKVKSVKPLGDGMQERVAEDYWSALENFASYSFNASHSAEYSLISWVTMWLKVYYPAEFYAAAMTVIDKEDKLAGLVTDAKQRGIEVLPPDITVSSNRIEIEDGDKLYAPFQAIKGISTNVAAAILKLRDAELPSMGIFKGGFTLGATGNILEFDPAVQKKLLGVSRVAVNASNIDKLSRVGALWRLNKVGHPPLHADRLKDRLELMPGFTVELVRASRGLSTGTVAELKITRLVEEMRACSLPSMQGKPIPSPVLGKKAKFMLVFDAPDWQEEKAMKMMTGKPADVVKAGLKGGGLSTSDGYFTSLSKTPKERGTKTLTNQQINDGATFLKQEIEILKPAVIIAMGSNAVRYFSPGIKGSPADLAGKVIFDADLDASIVFGLNPSMLYFDSSKLTLVESVFDQLYTLLS